MAEADQDKERAWTPFLAARAEGTIHGATELDAYASYET